MADAAPAATSVPLRLVTLTSRNVSRIHERRAGRCSDYGVVSIGRIARDLRVGPADLAAVGPLDLLGDSQSTSGEGCATSELPQVDQRLMNAVAPPPVLRRLHTSELMT